MNSKGHYVQLSMTPRPLYLTTRHPSYLFSGLGVQKMDDINAQVHNIISLNCSYFIWTLFVHRPSHT